MDTHTFCESSSIIYQINRADLTMLAKMIAEDIRNDFRQQQDKEILITRKDAAKMLGRSVETLWRWAKEGHLMPIKHGGRLLYRKSDIMGQKNGGVL